jgi:ABC-type multidrug transport system ATPase subunit
LTPVFRSPFLCEAPGDDRDSGPDANRTACYTYTNFQREAIDYTTTVENIDFGDADVSLIAVREPGGYGMILGAIFCFALTFPGAVWSTSYIPGYKIPLFSISLITLILPLLPAVWHATRGFNLDGENFEQIFSDCSNVTDPNNVCSDFTFNLSDVDGDFVNCAVYEDIGEWELFPLCSAPHTALLPQFGLYQMLIMTYRAKVRFVSDPPEWVEEVLVPVLKNNGVRCSGAFCNVPRINKVYGLNVLYMLIGALLLLLLGAILASIFGFPIGFVLRLRKRIAKTLEPLRFRNRDRETTSKADSTTVEDEEFPEVEKERKKVRKIIRPYLTSGPEGRTVDLRALPRDEIAPVVGSGLRKVYPGRGGRPPKVALDGLDLQVPRGQVLGFLGKNGAGKTTALKIWAGDHDASDGIGLVAGYDSGIERIPVFERLGNCPQFDKVWKSRTVRGHLELMSGLKGVPREHARSIASAVGLGSDAFYHRKAGELSGGMRRRLTIAMSLIGSPAVLILDEPTTGLDPSTRSSIWALVNSFANQNRSTIITTHMMVEADTLCNRIAIIAEGKLKVVGTQQHLKDKFGSGYLLQLNVTKSNKKSVKKAMKFVKKHLHPKAVLATKQAKTLHVNLPREDLDLQKVFAALYSPEASSKGCINQFLLSQSSLEDVFVALGD